MFSNIVQRLFDAHAQGGGWKMVSDEILPYISRYSKYQFLWWCGDPSLGSAGFRPLGCLCNMAWQPDLSKSYCDCIIHYLPTCPIEHYVYPIGGHVVREEGV